MKYYLIAGEASGDLHGSLLMRALAARDPQAQFRFRGGEKMAAVAGEMVHDYRDTAVMGLLEVLSKAKTVKRNLTACKAEILSWKPDVVILIDYPGFNLKIARYAHEQGLKVFYYIAPKVWASRERRVEQLRQYVDRLFVIFPFEVEWFRSRGVDVVYEGNPLVDHIDSMLAAAPCKEEFLRANGLDSRPLVALLPGSRMQEIKYLAPRFCEVALRVRRQAGGSTLPKEGASPSMPEEAASMQFAVAAAPGIAPEVYERYFPGIPVIYGQTYALLKHSDAAVVASGTASLEAAIIGTPQVVCYGMNPLTWHIAIRMLKVKYISLANLILDKLIFKELLQEECTAENIFSELKRLTCDKDCRALMREDYAAVRAALGDCGSADRIAEKLISYMK